LNLIADMVKLLSFTMALVASALAQDPAGIGRNPVSELIGGVCESLLDEDTFSDCLEKVKHVLHDLVVGPKDMSLLEISKAIVEVKQLHTVNEALATEIGSGHCTAHGEAQFLCMNLQQESCEKRSPCYWVDASAALVQAPVQAAADGHCMAHGEAQFLCMKLPQDRCEKRSPCYWVDASAAPVQAAAEGRCMAHGEAQFLCMKLPQDRCEKRSPCYWADASVALVQAAADDDAGSKAMQAAADGHCMADGEAQFLCMHLPLEQCEARNPCRWVNASAPLQVAGGHCMAHGEAQFLCMNKAESQCTGICYWVEASAPAVNLRAVV
jgi:hypothetical protein